MSHLLLPAAFALILGGAIGFTNAVEWAGHQLSLGAGAVGGILAAVATALPESAIPVAALVTGSTGSEDVAVGSILGAPFVLGTLAMALVGWSALGFRGRREQGERVEPHLPTFTRELAIFLVVFAAALALAAVDSAPVRWAAAGAFVAVYAIHVAISLRRGGEVQGEGELRPLHIDPTREDPPHPTLVAVQSLAGLAMIVYGAHLFVEQLTELSRSAGVAPLALALVIAPLATELPEKLNSVLWVRRGRDELALGNISGAMVFQASIPVSVGLVFTSWNLDGVALLASAAALAGAGLALWAGRRGRFGAIAPMAWAAAFSAVVVVALTTG